MQAGNPEGPTAVLVGPTAVSANIAPVGRTTVLVGRDSVPATLPVLLHNLIPTLVLLLLLASCGMFTGTPHANRPAVGAASMPPAAGELEAALTAELARLGKPYKMPASAPSGTANAAFDLAAVVVESGGQATGVQLTWTERLLGDYNQDGQVNAGDLAPLGINWQQAVQYDAASAHGGIAYWPAGDPGDGAAGAANWRRARIDGNADGVLDVKDVTAVAVHWQERMSGCRVYRKGPGESSFTMIPGPGDDTALTLPRPAVVPTAPVRYSFSDTPPLAGQYEYYVAAAAALEGEAEGASNHATADLAAGFADTQPPQWQGTAGIGSIAANTDGTVTLQWGTAVDTAAPPAPASPPVTYTVYYSTQTPIDFATAAKAAGVTGSPWTSPALPGATPYYFAVRASDSATPKPNEDANTAELMAVPAGGPAADTDPPVWTTQDLDGNTVSGIYSIAANDGELVITCADASDALTPPVHYDLYYISGRKLYPSSIYYFKPLDLPAGYQVIPDIPKIYHFTWENRHRVYVAVCVRDSANPPNTAYCYMWIPTAPADVERIPMDPTIPGYDPAVNRMRGITWAYEPEQHLIYKAYAFGLNGQKPFDVWFATINGDTGNMQGQYVMTGDKEITNDVSLWLARSWTGDLWLEVLSEKPASMYRRRPNGAWEPWGVDFPVKWDRQFDQNGLPAYFDAEASDVQSGRCKLSYNWYNESAHQWVREFVCDPGAGSASIHRRPDGVLQVISPQDWSMPDDVTPTYARVFERYPDGHWVNIITAPGYIADRSGWDTDMDTWDAQWAWSGSTNIHGFPEIVTYGTNGFEYLPNPDINGESVNGEKAWPAAGGSFHILPYYLRVDGELRWYETHVPNYLAAPLNPDPNNQLGFFDYWGAVYNSYDGFFAGTAIDYNLATGRMQASMIKPAHGKTIFIP